MFLYTQKEAQLCVHAPYDVELSLNDTGTYVITTDTPGQVQISKTISSLSRLLESVHIMPFTLCYVPNACMIILERSLARSKLPACMLLHTLLPARYEFLRPLLRRLSGPTLLYGTIAHALFSLLEPCLRVLLHRLLLHSFLPLPPLGLGYAHLFNALLAVLSPKPRL